jgi:hypothetical protein
VTTPAPGTPDPAEVVEGRVIADGVTADQMAGDLYE